MFLESLGERRSIVGIRTITPSLLLVLTLAGTGYTGSSRAGTNDGTVGHSAAPVISKPGSCKPAPSRKRERVQQVFKWVDENGVTQYSSSAPASASGSVRALSYGKDDYFSLNIDTSLSRLSGDTVSRMQAGVTLIYRMLVDVVGVSELQHIHLNVKLVDDRGLFDSYRNKVAPGSSATTTGFYQGSTNESVIYSGMGAVVTTKIMLHESTHAIAAAMFGDTTPVWLNEGLASYMEELEIQGSQTRRVGHDPGKLRTIRMKNTPFLSELLGYDRTDWYNHDRLQDNYAFSWSVVRYMMSNSNGIGLLRSMLTRLAAGDCVVLAPQEHIDSHYPGGFKAFDAGWKRWVKRGREGVQVF